MEGFQLAEQNNERRTTSTLSFLVVFSVSVGEWGMPSMLLSVGRMPSVAGFLALRDKGGSGGSFCINCFLSKFNSSNQYATFVYFEATCLGLYHCQRFKILYLPSQLNSYDLNWPSSTLVVFWLKSYFMLLHSFLALSLYGLTFSFP